MAERDWRRIGAHHQPIPYQPPPPNPYEGMDGCSLEERLSEEWDKDYPQKSEIKLIQKAMKKEAEREQLKWMQGAQHDIEFLVDRVKKLEKEVQRLDVYHPTGNFSFATAKPIPE